MYVYERSEVCRAAGRTGSGKGRSYLCGEAVALLTGPWMPSQALHGSSRFTNAGTGQLVASLLWRTASLSLVWHSVLKAVRVRLTVVAALRKGTGVA